MSRRGHLLSAASTCCGCTRSVSNVTKTANVVSTRSVEHQLTSVSGTMAQHITARGPATTTTTTTCTLSAEVHGVFWALSPHCRRCEFVQHTLCTHNVRLVSNSSQHCIVRTRVCSSLEGVVLASRATSVGSAGGCQPAAPTRQHVPVS